MGVRHGGSGTLVRQQDALHISGSGNRRIGIRGVENNLYGFFGRSAIRCRHDLTVVIVRKDGHGIDIAAAQDVVYLSSVDVSLERKVRVGRKPFHLTAYRFRPIRSDGCEIYVFGFHRNGEPEQERLHDGNQQGDEHRARIAQNVQRLFFDK